MDQRQFAQTTQFSYFNTILLKSKNISPLLSYVCLSVYLCIWEDNATVTSPTFDAKFDFYI